MSSVERWEASAPHFLTPLTVLIILISQPSLTFSSPTLLTLWRRIWARSTSDILAYATGAWLSASETNG